MPRFKHDCKYCTSLGQWNEYDLYHCSWTLTPTLIARYGTNGDYLSGIYQANDIAPIAIAFVRASILKLPLTVS